MTTVARMPQPQGPEPEQRHPSPGRAVKAPVSSTVLGPGRSDVGASVRGLFNSYAPLGYMLPWEVLDYVELLATYNPDYSQAVDNIKTLANSGHELFVQANSDLKQRQIKNLLEGVARSVQQAHGGIDGVIDKLLDQGATFGAMCGEWVLNEELTAIVDFVDISPKNIRFFWDSTKGRYTPWQKVNAAQETEARRNGQRTMGGCVELNETTFHYYAFDAMPESPYGTPPYLAALPNIAIQRDMIANMSQIVKKIGLLGIIDVVVERLPPQPGESANDYMTRAGNYLDEYAGVVQDMVRDGGMVHFDDVEVKATNLAGNAAGATNIFKQNEELIFSGLKSMPSVQGRSYSTTETYAGVAYDIIIRNTRKYQRAVKRMIESGYWLAASLAGYTPTDITIKFNDNKTLHRLQDAQSEALEIKNALTLWVLGIIDQTMMAQRLGHDAPVKMMDEPPESDIIGNAGNVASASGSEGGDPEESGTPTDQPTRSDNSVTSRSIDEEDPHE
jgi:hypothetical protein